MSNSSRIEWTDTTWNPVLGCDRVSPGCDGCYAIPGAHIRASNPNPTIASAFSGLTHRVNGRIDWTGRINLIKKRLAEPLRWSKPRRVFVNSMSDLFHDKVPDEFIARVFAVMALAERHTFQVLTKRHGRMRSLLRSEAFSETVQRHAVPFARQYGIDTTWAERATDPRSWPLPNVWVGVSVEDQKRADLRIPALFDTPATVRFLSCEPLLSPVDLSRWLGVEYMDALEGYGEELGAALSGRVGSAGGLHWVIAGGESGPGARPMHPDWVRTLRDQCTAAGVAFFFKQWGNWRPQPVYSTDDRHHVVMPDGRDRGTPWPGWRINQPAAVVMERVGKKAAGRQLDGRTWDAYPAVTP